jgi:hypothetical protein
MKLIFQIAAGIVLASAFMSLCGLLVVYLGARSLASDLSAVQLPQFPQIQRPVIRAAPPMPWPAAAPVVAVTPPASPAPDVQCTSYVQTADGQRHCYVKQRVQ